MVGSHPYLRKILPRSLHLFGLKLYLLSGSAFNHFEAAFLEARSSAFFSLSLKLFKMLVFFWFVLSVFSVLSF